MKRPRSRTARGIVLALVLSCLPRHVSAAEPRPPDPRAAEQQFRLARRLAAEGSPDADAALEKVLELDPSGPLADDALVERALIQGIAQWPAELGTVTAWGAARASEYLDEVLERLPEGDRAGEAALLDALLRLEPLGARDLKRIRVDLLSIATRQPSDGEVAARARHGAGWIDERDARAERARATFQRLALDHADSPAAVRAAVGLGRLALLEGRFDEAVRNLQQAVESRAPAETRASELRELAVRSLLRIAGTGGTWSGSTPARADTRSRGAETLQRAADGGIVVADRRQGILRYVDGRSGQISDRAVAGLQTLAVDGLGRVLLVTDAGVLHAAGDATYPVGGLGEFDPVSVVAADDLGRLWLVDRKGARVGLLEPGAAAAREVWRSEQRKITGLAWDGRRIVALDARTDTLFEIDTEGGERPFEGPAVFQKPVWVTAAHGQVAVLDTRLQAVVLLGPDGRTLESFDYRSVGADRPVAIALGPDGSLDLLQSDGSWMRLP